MTLDREQQLDQGERVDHALLDQVDVHAWRLDTERIRNERDQLLGNVVTHRRAGSAVKSRLISVRSILPFAFFGSTAGRGTATNFSF